MSRRPKRLKIAPYTWAVRWTLRDVLKFHPNGDACGSCDLASTTIAIASGQSEDYNRSILLHEILHACIRSSDPTLDDDAEETAVAAITGPLLATLRENPELIEYLRAEP